MNRRMLFTVLISCALAVGACSQASESDETTRDDDGSIVDEGEIGAFRIQVGDCLGTIEESGQIETAQGIPCDQEHQYEVYHAFDLPDGDFPGQVSVSSQAEEGCLAAFDPFVGIEYAVSIYGFTSLIPTQQSWDAIGDREVLCLLGNFDGTPKTGSAAGTGV